METKRITVPELGRMKAAGERVTMVTAYDWTFARLLDAAGVELLLVGDSLGMVMQGQDTTLPVTLDEMVYHTRLVARGARRALVVSDLPFGAYQTSPERAVENAVRLVKEGGAAAVKLEGGVRMADTIAAISSVDIPVMGHVGLTPQSVHRMGGHKVQGRRHGHEAGGRERVLDDARAVQDAGAFAVVLEGIPLDLAAEITAELEIPTIGIGAGVHCDGQVLVLHDLLGLTERAPKFAKAYVDLSAAISSAAADYVREVKGGVFPTDAHSFHALTRLAQAS
ncbi:MAG TPA: 3-methyl-2-oxobutanoate hydroxymethyltransferase [Candidatus Binatia bacterium]|jgi:3-methyl-2-oxobutanoate hydroxymethyltransferase|nr:3-methyl-2-oxobutanoate hydroxymethyltransferase [Candidatus Binatia bacterium]